MPTARDPRSGGAATASRLRPLKELQSYTIGATDGDIGAIKDVYFDDQSWTARYLVVDTGRWLPGREVLIPPRAIQQIDADGRRLTTNLTRQQVKDSPPIETDRPVSRPYEMELHGYYGYPYYWAGPYRWGLTPLGYGAPYPVGSPLAGESMPSTVAEELAARERAEADPHLRSARDVRGHRIKATDGELGHVEDFWLEEDSFAIRYLIVDPTSWWPGPHVLISTEWITAVNWADAVVEVKVTKQQVKDAPQYDSSAWLDRDYEARYYSHYGRRAYWERPDELWRL
jgi:sporulation protein YlmC with PRC-barrel domain